MRFSLFSLAACLVVGPLLFVSNSSVRAQPLPSTCSNATSITGSLVTLINSGVKQYTCLERQSAIANQSTYNQLTIDPDGVNGPLRPICDPTATQPQSPTCTGATLLVFMNTRELVQTANELLGGGAGRPTRFSLGLDAEGLGFALRWTAAEEMTAPGSVNTEFANGQIASVTSRISALRMGASGFSVAGMPASNGSVSLAQRDSKATAKGGGASADAGDNDNDNDDEDIASKWGGFLNGSFSWGDRSPTQLEDAFAFDSNDLTLGVDYRLDKQFVLGAMIGYSKQRVDFDSTRSVVEGDMQATGYSFTVYALQEWNGPYLSGSLGLQRMSIDSRRVINYPSFNVLVESVYATATGDTQSSNLLFTSNFGWPLNRKALGFEPYARAEYAKITIDGFAEHSVNNVGPNAGLPAGFDFNFDEQSITSLDTAIGFRLQYAFTPKWGVITPYVISEYHHNFQDTSHDVRATFNGAGSSSSVFDLPSDTPDASYYTFSGGFSLVLRGGIQGFAQYRTVESLQSVTHQSISIGLRAEF